jgi:hypothetical protein
MALCCLRIFSFLFSWSKDMPITLGDTTISGLGAGSYLPANALSGRVPAGNAPLGSVIQVVNHVTTSRAVISQSGGTTITSTSGGQYASFSVTPLSSTSKLMLLSSTFFIGERSNASDAIYAAAFYDTTLIGSVLNYSSFGHWAGNHDSSFVSFNHLFDSWGTTAKNIVIRVGAGGSSTMAVNHPNWTDDYTSQFNSPNRHQVTFTIMEILA